MTGALTVGLAARGYRNTVGARAYRASESDDLKKRAAQSGVRGMMARAQLRTSRAAANATGDFRNTAIPGADRLGKGTRRSYANLAAEQKREGQAMSKYLGSPTKEEKAKIANVKKQQDTELEQMREQVDQQRKQVKELKEDAQDAGRNPAEQPGYNSARDALRRMEKDLEATEKRLKTELKSYETPLRARQESYASTYEQLNPYGLREFFRPADKDTAEAIRSELQKDKNQKLIDSIKDVSNENSK
ncbi:hypothetical protein GVX82_03070 [Patescibacteria group bacterium]|jgi:hypothetical protein|nr:hypothetical protein [Patescibacteria group bacterium]